MYKVNKYLGISATRIPDRWHAYHGESFLGSAVPEEHLLVTAAGREGAPMHARQSRSTGRRSIDRPWHAQGMESNRIDGVYEVVDAVAFECIVLLLHLRAWVYPLNRTPALDRRLHKPWGRQVSTWGV